MTAPEASRDPAEGGRRCAASVEPLHSTTPGDTTARTTPTPATPAIAVTRAVEATHQGQRARRTATSTQVSQAA